MPCRTMPRNATLFARLWCGAAVTTCWPGSSVLECYTDPNYKFENEKD